MMLQRNKMDGIHHVDSLKHTKLRQLQQICLIFAVEYTIGMRERRNIGSYTL